MNKTVVLNIVGLTPELLGPATPALSAFLQRAKMATINAATPAVTCTAQATYFTGTYPDKHGIVANGWYFQDECEVKFWRQSNHLVTAPASPRSVPSPTQATYPSGRIRTAVGAATSPSAGNSHPPS